MTRFLFFSETAPCFTDVFRGFAIERSAKNPKSRLASSRVVFARARLLEG